MQVRMHNEGCYAAPKRPKRGTNENNHLLEFSVLTLCKVMFSNTLLQSKNLKDFALFPQEQSRQPQQEKKLLSRNNHSFSSSCSHGIFVHSTGHFTEKWTQDYDPWKRGEGIKLFSLLLGVVSWTCGSVNILSYKLYWKFLCPQGLKTFTSECSRKQKRKLYPMRLKEITVSFTGAHLHVIDAPCKWSAASKSTREVWDHIIPLFDPSGYLIYSTL